MIRQTILRIVSHPFTLSLVLGSIIILCLPPIFNKYKAKLLSAAKSELTHITFYHDFDHNGASNKIVFFYNPIQPHVIIWENNKIIDQWDHPGEYAKGDFFFFADYNHDNLDELYFLTISNDSIYLKGINPYATDETGFLYKKIDSYKKKNNENDCGIAFIKATDLTGDGYQELVFSVSTGYTAYPRKIYAYDIKTSNLIESDPSCFPILQPMAFDLNKDGIDEFICNNSAFTNCDTLSFPTYNDQKAWLVVLDKNLNYLFDPVSFGEYMTGIKVRPIHGKDSVYLFAYQFHHGTKEIGNRLFLFDLNGRVIRERDVPDYVHSDDFNLIIRNSNDQNHLYLIQYDGTIKQLDTSLSMIDYAEIEGERISLGLRSDLDDDGFDEFIFSVRSVQDLIITRNDFSHPVRLNILGEIGVIYKSIVKSPDGNFLFIQNDGYDLLYSYKKNPLYYLKYVFYLAIFLVLYLLFFALQKMQHARANHKFETERKIADLQIKSLKNQIDPHFTLNLINSIGTLFYNKDQKKASSVFDKYSKLLRNTIVNSDNIENSIKDELEFVQNYLELEKFRYADKFDYQIIVEKNVNVNHMIPKMLIHTFVENAIKHGIKHLEKDGLVKIQVAGANSDIIISVSDNGVGRDQVKQLTESSTTRGLKIVDQIIHVYQEIKQIMINYTITDLFHESRPAGTRVDIYITPGKPRQKFKNIFER